MFTIDLTDIIIAAITIIAAIVVNKLTPWIKSNTTAKQQELIDSMYRTLVFAAEQLYGANNGSEKLDYVVQELEKRGFTADRAKIEATVWEYLNSGVIEVENEVVDEE